MDMEMELKGKKKGKKKKGKKFNHNVSDNGKSTENLYDGKGKQIHQIDKSGQYGKSDQPTHGFSKPLEAGAENCVFVINRQKIIPGSL